MLEQRLLGEAGSFLTTKSFTASPDFGSCTLTAAASRTPGCIMTTSSISFGNTLKPDTTIMSFLRSVILKWPRRSMKPMSPVRSQPSRVNTFAVSSGTVPVTPHDLRAANADLVHLAHGDFGT